MAYSYRYQQQKPPTVCVEKYRGERLYTPPPAESLYGAAVAATPLPPVYAEMPNYQRQERLGELPPVYAETPNYQRQERLGELGAVAATAFAVYEEHRAKSDPAQVYKHKLEADATMLGGVGSNGYAYNEHRGHKNNFEDGRWY